MSYNFLTLSMTNYLESCKKKKGRLIWDYSITNPLGTFCITKFTLKAFQPAIRNSFSAPLGWHTSGSVMCALTQMHRQLGKQVLLSASGALQLYNMPWKTSL